MDDQMTESAAAPDWAAVRIAYQEDGTKSLRAIARAHRVSHAAIRKRATKEGWRRAEKEEAAVSSEVSNPMETETVETAVIYDNDSGKPDAPPDVLGHNNRLVTTRDVRLAISRVIRAEVAGKVEHNRARGLVWMLRQHVDVIELADLERRIAELEARQEAGALPALPYKHTQH